ncbi:MAG: T9SS type A sorting domain-containing protein [Elusimicrobiota bacterium]|nr:T9SS type A sorting domain-containing protein [Elusimicrobiota bacterium]
MRKIGMNKLRVFLIISISVFISANNLHALDGVGTIAWDPAAYTNTISWTAATPNVTDSTNTVITYYVFRQFGQVTPSVTAANPAAPAAVSGSELLGTTDKITWIDILNPIGNWDFGADYRYSVVAFDNNGTKLVAGDDVSTTFYTFSGDVLDFIHAMTRADENGTQDGFGQRWTFTYKLKWDAYINMEIYSPNGTFTIGSSNVVTTYDGEVFNSSAPLKTIIDYTNLTSAARSFQMIDNSYTNEDVWDCRDSSGNVVPNGLYYVLFRAYTHNPFTGTPRFVGQWWGTIPVDILRITDTATQGISGTGGTASINYTINGDANMYILICSSGTSFTRATAEGDLTFLSNNTYHYYPGFPLPLNNAKTAVDSSKLQKVLVFYRKYGTYSEAWNGLDQNGGTMPNGIYAISFAGRDGYGNNALDAQGDDGPIETTITIDKTQAETAQDSTPPTVSNWYVNGNAVAAGATLDQPITSVSADISDETGGSGVNITVSAVTVTGPGGSITGTLTNDSIDTITFTPTASQTTNGSYTITVTAVDTTGNSQVYTRSFTLNVTAAGAASTFESSVKAYPNPAKGVPANISYNINAPSTLTLEIFNLLGDLVYTKEWTKLSAGAYAEPWNLVNDSGSKIGSGVFLYRIKANDGASTYSVTKKLIAIQ